MDQAKTPRDQGIEARAELHAVLRTGQQMLVTTGTASPRSAGEMQRVHSSADVRGTLSNLRAFMGNRSTAADQVGAQLHASVTSSAWVTDALRTTAEPAVGPSKPNQVHWAQGGTSASRR